MTETKWTVEQGEPTNRNPSGLVASGPNTWEAWVNHDDLLCSVSEPPADVVAELLDRWRAWKRGQSAAIDLLTEAERTRGVDYLRSALVSERCVESGLRLQLKNAQKQRDKAVEQLTEHDEDARRTIAQMREAVEIHSGRYDVAMAERNGLEEQNDRLRCEDVAQRSLTRDAQREAERLRVVGREFCSGRETAEQDRDRMREQRDEAIRERSEAQSALAFFKPGLGVPFGVKDAGYQHLVDAGIVDRAKPARPLLIVLGARPGDDNCTRCARSADGGPCERFTTSSWQLDHGAWKGSCFVPVATAKETPTEEPPDLPPLEPPKDYR